MGTSATAADFKTLASRMETAMRGEIQNLKQEVTAMDSVLEQEQGMGSQSIQTLQSSHTGLTDQIIQLQLLLDDLENRSRRRTIRLTRVPVSVPQLELCSRVTTIFNCYLDHPHDTEVVIDRVHRTLWPTSHYS